MTTPTDDAVDRLRISMVVSEIESAHEVLACLKDVDATVHSETVMVNNPTRSPVQLTVDDLTAKQWQALELAYQRGYYETPRETDLSTLAAELDISKSAVSQRLRGAEATLIESVMHANQQWVDEP
ncbi:helix-turn-helix domain-containing protein [Natrarchaeobaculum sulfurireducens]|uniref:Transcriptional regulator, contains HTH domain n=1 Tax=Natrarchaeobaculum sulfurireducens TaxID=2044521 RepID=A0A346PEM3_9EURY|nr:helix-turn-helix domain-containing protein [Natrarchaeobaculum sulfurireducens]AXR77968.1 Transcriptional regulator, contains HTH domain [Natrarchaeobaculum sulfurireducens]